MNRAAPAPPRLVLWSLARLLSPLLLALLFCLTTQGQKREPRKLFPIPAQYGGGTGFIDRTGKLVIPPDGADFTDVVQSGKYRLPSGPSWATDSEAVNKDPHRRRLHINNFSEGLARFSIDTTVDGVPQAVDGYIDREGRVVWERTKHLWEK